MAVLLVLPLVFVVGVLLALRRPALAHRPVPAARAAVGESFAGPRPGAADR